MLLPETWHHAPFLACSRGFAVKHFLHLMIFPQFDGKQHMASALQSSAKAKEPVLLVQCLSCGSDLCSSHSSSAVAIFLWRGRVLGTTFWGSWDPTVSFDGCLKAECQGSG